MYLWILQYKSFEWFSEIINRKKFIFFAIKKRKTKDKKQNKNRETIICEWNHVLFGSIKILTYFWCNYERQLKGIENEKKKQK